MPRYFGRSGPLKQTFLPLLSIFILPGCAVGKARTRADVAVSDFYARHPAEARAASACANDRLTTGCGPLFSCAKSSAGSKFEPAASVRLSPALQTLVDYSESRGRHAVKIKHGRAYVDIGFLTAGNDQVFLAYLFGALKEGAIAEIQTGTIVGPKVLALLMRLDRVVPENASIRVVGRLSAAVLETIVSNESTFFDQASGQTVVLTPEIQALLRSQNGISPSDVREFQNAVDKLGVKGACLRFYRAISLRGCGELDFEFDGHRPERVDWSMAR